MTNLLKYIDYFIPENIRENPFLLRKSKVMVFIILFSIILGIILLCCKFFINEKEENPVDIWSGIIMSIFVLLIFKKTGKLSISGNLLALTWMLSLVFYVPQTGGLNSDNLLWLILTPLIALLFSNKKSGFIWLSALIMYTIGLYFYDDSIIQTVTFDKSYYLISYIFLFLTIFSTILIFEHGQILIIKLLEQQKQELNEQKKQLELKNQEILDQKIQLEKIGSKLKETNYALEHFAATAAHDLREPLRMISMYTGLAQRRMLNIPDARRDEYMNYATDGATRMSVLLDNLLSFSRSGRQVQDLKAVNLNTVLYNVILNLSVVLKDTGASITSAQLPTLTTSESDMSQLFQNLIANAVKFRKENIISEVEIGYIERKKNHIITIKDNGIGIKKEHQTKVFAIFQRLNGREKYDGSGIGLATCRKIVENIDGKIWLQSEEGEGTTFFIAIPKSKTTVNIGEDEFAYA
jgi:signal transduction histidine kinase